MSKKDDVQYIHSVLTAANIKSIMDHRGWESVIAVVNKLQQAAYSRSESARRSPSLDKMFEATHFDGQVAFAKNLLRTFVALYNKSDVVLTDARKILPRAPMKGEHETKKDPASSVQDNLKEETDDRAKGAEGSSRKRGRSKKGR